MSRAIRIHGVGSPEVLRFEEVDPGRPGPGQALVRHSAVGINFIDTYHRSGLYPLPSLPHGLGMEAAGRIEAVGDGVTEFGPGDRVAYATGPPGAYAEARVVAADRLVRLPDGIDERVAAASLLRGLTVEYLIRRTFRVERGMTVLFHAAAGGVGLIACQWLRHLGATVIGTVGSDEKAAIAREHGCTHVIVYSREQVAARVREITGGQGVPVVYDSVGRATLDDSLGSLQRRGMLVSFGNASGPPPPIDPLTLLRKGSLFLTRPTLVDYAATRAELLAGAAAFFDVLETKAVKVEVKRTWPLAQAAEAHRALESRQTSGSSILIP